MDGFGECVAFLEEIVEVRLLVAVRANVHAQILVWFMCIIGWDGDFGVVCCNAVVDAYGDW